MNPLRWTPLVLALVASAAPLSARPQDPKNLLDQIAREEDDVDARLFDTLAQIGTADAFKHSKKAVGHLRIESKLNRAYGAFRFYAGSPELKTEAIAFLQHEVFHHRRDENQRAATFGMAYFGTAAAFELEKIARKHDDPVCRTRAVKPILGILAERGDEDAVVLILENASIRAAGESQAVANALAKLESPEAFELFYRKLADRSASPEWRFLLLERIEGESHPSVVPVLMDLLRDEDPQIQLRAVEILGERGEPQAERSLWKLLRSKDDLLLHATVVALGKIMGADPKWQDRLFGLAEDRRTAARIGSAVALAELRTARAVEALHGLLFDSERPVRLEAVQQVGNLRRKDSIPILIERLAAEKGRLKQDLATVLRLITGLDNGTSRGRWKAWWDGEGAGFEVPPYEQALAAENERRARRANNVSLASFYGLNVVSDRVCFILDVSGSMSFRAQGNAGRTSSDRSSGPTRIDVAKDELTRTLTAFPDGDQFNVIFFESRVRVWEDELVEMDAKSRKRVLEFVAEQNANGGTALFDAVETAMQDELVDTIYLLTDGDPSAGRIIDRGLIRAEIKRMNGMRKVQINCISIGQASQLLQWLAADSGGQYREIR